MRKQPDDDMAAASLRDERGYMAREMEVFDEWRKEPHAQKLDVFNQQLEGRRPS